jgi:hypothetical protein
MRYCGHRYGLPRLTGVEETMTGFLRKAWLLSAALTMCCISASAQTASEAAAPDFSSGGIAWAGIGGGPFLPVSGSPSPIRQDPRYRYTPNNTDEQPTFRIGDISNPNLMPWAKDVMKKDNDEVAAGKIAFTPRSSCKPGGVPGFMSMGGGALFFVQSPTEVTMIFDGNAETRHIHMNVPHAANLKPSWYGDSVGHYEGDTLVIDTIGLNDKTFLDSYRTPHTDKLHVTERWRLIDNGEKLEVVMTVDDPGTFYQPWKGMRHYGRVKRSLAENICAENNGNLFDYGTPTADKPDF